MKLFNIGARPEDFELIFNHIPMGIAYLDRDFKILNMNPYLLKKLGVSLENVRGRHCYELHAELLGEIKKDLKTCNDCKAPEAMETGEMQTFVKEITPGFIVENIMVPVKNERGEVIGVIELFQDITESIQTDRELRESEEKYKSLVENIGIGVALISPAMEIITMNKQMNKWFPNIDVSKKPVCFQTFNDAPREDICSCCPTIKTLQDGQVHESVTDTPLGNEIRNYRIISSPIFNSDGKVTAAIEMVEDITEGKKAEIKIQEYQNNLEGLVKERTERLSITNRELNKEIANRKQAEKEREATIEFLRFTNESRGTKELSHAAIAFLQKQSACEAVGIRLKEKNDYPYYETRGFSDEFVLAETRLCARDEAGLLICDSTGNPVLECMCGNVICGRFDPSKPFFTAQGSFWSNHTTELLASSSEADRQSRTRNRCNSEGYESVALIPLRLGTECLGLLQLNDRRKERFNLETIALLERLAGYLAVALSKFQSEEKLQVLNEELEMRVEERTHELLETQKQYLHAEKLSAIGKLSASIAHEFNNPLQSVMTIIKGIDQYVPLEKTEAELVTLALEECQRMKNLIANLRDFFQPTSGILTQVDIHALLDPLLLICKKDFHTRKISIIKKYADNLPSIMGVIDQLKQVFLNLLNNAADACQGDGMMITITTEVINGENIAVRIEDNGIGISPENIAHIFEPFFTTKQDLKGTGLGLSVSYGIIKKHGGYIDVKSEPGKGSKFSVFLPVVKV
ncbi:PAS domain-containing protein [Desulfopila sp. IMCC35006]|uniref:PAS domain-containing sensor histidine kinase n=1 Tax=Desulfopila sp. IMCC35006 TaxID=2569542 RepID=UPI0010AD6773|nr:ATP-binding protein [Desulfopila sp. IMCC35006]TKB24407.1 PAS domain-containing protein [Desulfopila sp. IMCC35006]